MFDGEDLPDHYRILGVSPTATLEEIQTAYRRKAARHHPDRGGSHARMVAINAARETLCDPVKRAAYDFERAARRREAAEAAAAAKMAEADSPSSKTTNTTKKPISVYSWKGFVQDCLSARYERALWLAWPPKITNSASGTLFIQFGWIATWGISWYLWRGFVPPVAAGRMNRLAMLQWVFLVLIAPSLGAAMHWCVRRVLQLFYPDLSRESRNGRTEAR